jgi:O-antigen/teichoic acid export membrane protein
VIEQETKTFFKTVESKQFNGSIAKTIAKAGMLVLFATLAGKLLKLATELVLAHSLGIEAYGVYTLAMSALLILVQFSSLGLRTGMVRFGAGYYVNKQYTRFQKLLKFSIYCVSAGGAVIGLSLVSLRQYLPNLIANGNYPTSMLYLIGLGLPFYGVLGIVAAAARSQKKIAIYTSLTILGQPLLYLILLWASSPFGLAAHTAFLQFIISSAIISFLGMRLLWQPNSLQEQVRPEEHPLTSEPSRWLTYSLPLIVIGISYNLLHETDRLMLGYFLGSKYVGLYNAASRLAYLAVIFVNSFSSIFGPMSAGLHEKGELENIRFVYSMTTRWTVVLTLPVATLLILFPEFFLGWFGKEYHVACSSMVFLTFAYLTSAGTGNTGTLLKMVDHQNIEVINTIATVVLNIALNIVLIPTYGIKGAATATGISIIVIQLVKLIEVKVLLGFTPYKLSFLKPVFSGTLCGSIILLIKKYIIISDPKAVILCGAAFILCYTLLLVALGLEKEEKAIWQRGWSLISNYYESAFAITPGDDTR